MTTELVVKLEGTVVESNLAVYEKEVQGWIDKINKNLVTDDDFARAESDIKEAKQVETNIHNSLQDALSHLGDIFELKTTMERWQERIRSEVRLPLERLVKSEKEARKNDVIDSGFNTVSELWKEAGLQKFFDVGRREFAELVKGKRSLEKMNEAINEFIAESKEHIANAKAVYERNLSRFKEAESEFPGLFHDKEDRAFGDPDLIEQTIENRINKFKLDMAEKDKKENTTEDAPNNAENSTAVDDNQKEVVVDQEEVYYVTIEINCTKDRAISFAEGLDANLGDNDIVKKIGLSK